MDDKMRYRLGNVVSYHQEMADSAKTRGGQDKLAAMHADAAKQLQDVLNADPPTYAVDQALANRPIRRNVTLAPRRRRLH